MIKRFLFIILTAFGLSQHAYAQLSYGVEAGFIRNTIPTQGKYQGDYRRDGFKFGGVVEYTLENHISFEAGLSFLRRRGEVHGSNLNLTRLDGVEFLQMYYLQIPLTIGYKFKIGKKFSIKPHLGYYYALGTHGDSFVTGTDAFGQPFGARVPTFASETTTIPYSPCNRHDIGLNFAMNFTYKDITVKLAYDRASTNATNYGNGRHRTFCASVVYWIK